MRISLLLILACILFSCNNKSIEKTELSPDSIKDSIQKLNVVKKDLVARSSQPLLKNVDTISKLTDKTALISQLRWEYHPVSNMGNFKNHPFIEIDTLRNVSRNKAAKELMLEIQQNVIKSYCTRFKGKIELSKNTYPRFQLYEFIFANDSIANSYISKVNSLKREHFSFYEMKLNMKSPSAMYVEDNRIYHIITGGHFMMGMAKEIEEILKQ